MLEQEEAVKVKNIRGSMDDEGIELNFCVIPLMTDQRSKGLWVWIPGSFPCNKKYVPLQGKQTMKRKEQR